MFWCCQAGWGVQGRLHSDLQPVLAWLELAWLCRMPGVKGPGIAVALPAGTISGHGSCEDSCCCSCWLVLLGCSCFGSSPPRSSLNSSTMQKNHQRSCRRTQCRSRRSRRCHMLQLTPLLLLLVITTAVAADAARLGGGAALLLPAVPLHALLLDIAAVAAPFFLPLLSPAAAALAAAPGLLGPAGGRW